MATKSVSIRLSLQDGETVRRTLIQLGNDGQKALARIEGAAQPASKSLLAMNAASQDIQGGMAGFASRLGPIGSVMMALGPAGLAAGAAIGFFGKAMVESTIKVESLEARLKGSRTKAQYEAAKAVADIEADITSRIGAIDQAVANTAADAEAAALSAANAQVSELAAAASASAAQVARMEWKGPWSAAAAYAVHDAVSLGGSSYVAIAPNTNQPPPDAVHWQVLASMPSSDRTIP